MIADVNLRVWLETDANTRPGMVIPYVQSSENKRIQYQLYAIKQGPGGTSKVGQSGTVQVPAQKPTALSAISLNPGKNDACQIELILAEGGLPMGTYYFKCPK
jgi:curli production protein